MPRVPHHLNDYVWVRLTPTGRKIMRANHRELVEHMKARGCSNPSFALVFPKPDKRGFTKWQTWHLMQEFGRHIHMGCNPPFHLDIEIECKTPA